MFVTGVDEVTRAKEQTDWKGYQTLLASRRTPHKRGYQVRHLKVEERAGLMSAATGRGEENRVPPLTDFLDG